MSLAKSIQGFSPICESYHATDNDDGSVAGLLERPRDAGFEHSENLAYMREAAQNKNPILIQNRVL